MAALLFGVFAQAANLTGLTVTGVNKDATPAPVTAYRWPVEEDLTYHVGFDANWNPITGPNTHNRQKAISYRFIASLFGVSTRHVRRCISSGYVLVDVTRQTDQKKSKMSNYFLPRP